MSILQDMRQHPCKFSRITFSPNTNLVGYSFRAKMESLTTLLSIVVQKTVGTGRRRFSGQCCDMTAFGQREGSETGPPHIEI